MDSIYRDIFKAIHEGKWLYLEYKNQEQEVSKFWFAIQNINITKKSLEGKGFHLVKHTVSQSMWLYIDSIQSTKLLEGTYVEVNKQLVEDIRLNPDKFYFMFPVTGNLRVLDYLASCNKLESVPHLNHNFHLINQIDDDTAKKNEIIYLTDVQVKQIVDKFCNDAYKSENKNYQKIERLCLNILSIHRPKGLYVLAYRELLFDVENKTLKPDTKIKFNKEFAFLSETGEKIQKESITRFIDNDELYLLNNFESNLNKIEDIIASQVGKKDMIDDRPYFLCLSQTLIIDLEKEYSTILKMYQDNKVTVPIQAFFGELKSVTPNKVVNPIVVLNKKVNLDQLLSIYTAINYPISYIQGPPGTGKTNTIINTIITAFFNNKTVLFSSYNNHPIDNVVEKLTTLQYVRKNGEIEIIPFPILRLGNNAKVNEALRYIVDLYKRVENIQIFSQTLLRNKDVKIEQTKKLVELLKKHKEAVELQERKETIEALINNSEDMEFRMVFEGNQLSQINKKLKEIGIVTDKEALDMLDIGKDDEFQKYLFYVSAQYLKQLSDIRYRDFFDILFIQDENTRLIEFNKFIAKSENLRRIQNIFPIICTTCISAHKLGDGQPDFDITIIDEASQCNTAISLIPIIRGKSLMLVGDPQQLNPVITLDKEINQSLKKYYNISDDYDYIDNSIYKTFLANDAISEEILLRNHYRCAKEIIDFSNKKYYNNQLNIHYEKKPENPLVFCDITDPNTNIKNTSEAEAKKIISYIKDNPSENIGIITPFKNQQELIQFYMEEEGLNNDIYPVGTVHSFQGDEKNTILLSLALTEKTYPKTYEWLSNNRELINVATSRAKDKLMLLTDSRIVSHLHNIKDDKSNDDIYELVEYVKNNGVYDITPRENQSRALGTKPYKTETETEFLVTLNHVLSNIITSNKKYKVEKEVQISHLFRKNISYSDFFYRGSFDFVIYHVGYRGKETPVLAIELNGREHYEDEKVRRRDEQKKKICESQGFILIYVENSYARRYNVVKQILLDFFKIR